MWADRTTPGFSQILNSGPSIFDWSRLSRFPFPLQCRTNTISTRWEEFSDDRPAFRNTEHARANRNMRRARAHTAVLVRPRVVKSSILWFINYITFGILLKLYPKSLKSQKPHKNRTLQPIGIRTGFSPLPRALSPAQENQKKDGWSPLALPALWEGTLYTVATHPSNRGEERKNSTE